MKKKIGLAALGALGLATLLATAASRPTRDAGAAWTDARHPPPRPGDWHSAAGYRARRVTGRHASACEVHRLEEWLRVRCAELETSAITQIGGQRTGVSTWIAPAGDDRMPGEGQLTFPARRGDARVFLLWTLGPGYDGPLTVVPAVVVQQYWLEGADAPVVLLSDALHEPVTTKSNPR